MLDRRRTWFVLGSLAVLVAVLTYLQNRYVVQLYGAGVALDDYYLVTTVPMSVAAMFGVVVTALLVPEIAEHLRADGVSRGVGRVLAVSFAVVSALVALSLPFARTIGLWASAPLDLAAVVSVGVGAVAYGLSFATQPYLVSSRRQSWFLASQAASNVVFVAALWLGLRSLPGGIYLAFALGGAAQAALAWTAVALDKLHMQFNGRVQEPGRLARRVSSGLPAVLSAVVLSQSGVLLDRWYMKAAGVGAVTCYLLADRIVQVTVSSGLTVIGLQVFPRMTSTKEGRRYTGLAVSNGAALMVPVAAGLFIAAGSLIDLLFLGGNFGVDSARLTSTMLSVFAVGLPALAIMQIAPRRLQYSGAYWWHVGFLGLALGVNLAVKSALVERLGAIGLVIGTVCGFVAAALGYCVFLGVKDGSFSLVDLRDLVVSAVTGVVVAYAASLASAPPLLVGTVAAVLIVVGMALLRVRGVSLLLGRGGGAERAG